MERELMKIHWHHTQTASLSKKDDLHAMRAYDIFENSKGQFFILLFYLSKFAFSSVTVPLRIEHRLFSHAISRLISQLGYGLASSSLFLHHPSVYM